MATIPLSNGLEALVDEADRARVMLYRWQVRSSRGRTYAQRVQRLGGGAGGPRETIQMHRFIVDCPRGYVVDHINGNGLDNRRENLRICSPGENLYNQAGHLGRRISRYKGVSPWPRGSQPWRARIRADGKQTTLGYFPTEEDAAIAYDEAAVRLHGHFARLNFPQPEDRPEH